MGALIGIVYLLIIALVLFIVLQVCDRIYAYVQRNRKPKISAWERARVNYIDKRL